MCYNVMTIIIGQLVFANVVVSPVTSGVSSTVIGQYNEINLQPIIRTASEVVSPVDMLPNLTFYCWNCYMAGLTNCNFSIGKTTSYTRDKIYDYHFCFTFCHL